MTDKHVQQVVLDKLGRLRTVLRGRLLAEGLGWLILALAGLVLVTLVFDYTLRLDRPLRAVILCLCLAGVGWTAWTRLLGPLLVPMAAEDLARLVENHFHELEDRLISALQLAERPAAVAAGMSPAMISRVTAEANEMAGQLPFTRVVERRRMWRVLGGALAIVLGLGGFSVARPDVMGLWFQRNLQFQNVDWPQDTYLNVFYVRTSILPDGTEVRDLIPLFEQNPDGTITRVTESIDALRGEDMQILVETTEGSRRPEEVTLHAWFPSLGKNTENPLDPVKDDQADAWRSLRPPLADPANGPRSYFALTIPAVSEELRFHVTGGDDERDARRPHQVRLVRAPSLEDLHFYIEFPSYMRRPDHPELDAARAILPIPLGAQVHLYGAANKDLAGARVLFDGKPIAKVEIDPREPRVVATEFSLGGSNEDAGKSVSMQVELRDANGYVNRRGQKYVLQVLPDRAPSSTLSTTGVRQSICPLAEIPLVASAIDDNHVAGIQLEYWLDVPNVAEDEVPAPDRLPAGMTEPKPVGPMLAAEVGYEPKLTAGQRLDIRPLKLPVGTRVYVRATSRDLLPEEFGGPNEGVSGVLSFTVISIDDLLAQLVSKQQEVSVEFYQAIGAQVTSYQRLQGAALLLDDDEITDEARKRIRDGAAKQLLVFNEVTKVRDSLDAIRLEMVHNRVGEAEDIANLADNVVAPLGRLLRDMQSVMDRLDRAAKLPNAGAMALDLRQLAAEQKVIYETMEEILKRMERIKNRVELIRRLETMKRTAEDLDDAIRRATEKGVLDLIEQTP